jgi:hypothetical protein
MTGHASPKQVAGVKLSKVSTALLTVAVNHSRCIAKDITLGHNLLNILVQQVLSSRTIDLNIELVERMLLVWQ